MSGHSKWHNIAQKKGKADKLRSNTFTKVCKAISLAAGQGGGDPTTNFSLRMAIEKAKEVNVPKENIERAIKRGTGEDKEGLALEEIVYEGFGPAGIAFVIEAVTDNKNRTVSEVKHTLSKYGGTLGGPGSVTWQFDHLGVIRVSAEEKNKWQEWEQAELTLIEGGVQNSIESEFGVEFHMPKETLQQVIHIVKKYNVDIAEAGLEWIAKEPLVLTEDQSQAVQELYEKVEELDDVKSVYTNEA